MGDTVREWPQMERWTQTEHAITFVSECLADHLNTDHFVQSHIAQSLSAAVVGSRGARAFAIAIIYLLAPNSLGRFSIELDLVSPKHYSFCGHYFNTRANAHRLHHHAVH